jgi:AraC-like DNA-binding protein
MQLLNLISTDHVAAPDRSDFWWGAVAESIVPVHGSSDQGANFRAEMRSLDLGASQLTRGRCVPFQARRSPALIRRSDPGLYHLSMILRGRSHISQADRQACLEPTDLVLYDTSRAFHVRMEAGDRPTKDTTPGFTDGLILQFPRDLLPLPAAMVERLLLRRMSGQGGIGGVLAAVLRQLMAEPEELSPRDIARMSTIVLDLVTAWIAHESEGESWLPAGDRAEALFVQIQSFIEQRLGEAGLTPSSVAAAHHISTRYLHRLFQRQGLTVAGWIRHRRLERCRRDLADPVMDGHAVNAVAARWGFTDDSHFNRLFRTAYEMPPAAYRRERHDRDMPSGVRERSTTGR